MICPLSPGVDAVVTSIYYFKNILFHLLQHPRNVSYTLDILIDQFTIGLLRNQSINLIMDYPIHPSTLARCRRSTTHRRYPITCLSPPPAWLNPIPSLSQRPSNRLAVTDLQPPATDSTTKRRIHQAKDGIDKRTNSATQRIPVRLPTKTSCAA